MNSRTYCECTDCQSVLSPSAYLVDLLHNFLGAPPNVPFPMYPVRDVLFGRRPDLLYLKLDCRNSELPIPYLDLVNEILEACIAYKTTIPYDMHGSGEPHPNETSANATAGDLAVCPENLQSEVYTILQRAPYPGTLPFNLPLETARAHLAELGISRYELLRAFRLDGKATDVAAACEVLHISMDEHAMLSTADVDGNLTASPYTLADYYGLPAPLANLQNVSGFLRFTGLELEDLFSLLKTRYVNPPSAPLSARLGFSFFKTDPSDLGQAFVENLNSDLQLDRIHRFLRLWRKTGISILDLDRCMQAWGKINVDDVLLINLADAKQIGQRTGLPIAGLLPLWSPIETYRYDETPSLYESLFLRKTVSLPLDECFLLTSPPADPELVGSALCTMTIDAHMATVQAALRLSANDVQTLASQVLTSNDLNLANLSALYRHALLARALGFTVQELLDLLLLHERDAFQTPAHTLSFVAFADSVRQSGFSLARLNDLYRARETSDPTRSFLPALMALNEGLASIRSDNLAAPDPTGDLTRKKLLMLYDAPSADVILGLIQGTSVWRTPLTTMPEVNVDAGLKKKLRYLADSNALQFSGAMTDSERDEFLIGQEPAFQEAIRNLWQQPRIFIEMNLATFPRLTTDFGSKSFLDPAQANTILLDPAKSVEDKSSFVLHPLLDYLVSSLSRDCVTQAISAAFTVEPALAIWLLQRGLSSRFEPAKPILLDFQTSKGVDARYFAGTHLDAAAVVASESHVDFNWGASAPAPGIAAGSFSAQWSAMLRAPDTQLYTLHVLANDGVRLWVDGQLLIDDWKDQPSIERTASIELKSGRYYELTLQYYQATAASALLQLSWSNPKAVKAIVPSSVLYPLDHWRLLRKAALLVSTFKLSAVELDHLVANATAFGGLNLNELPLHRSEVKLSAFSSWHRLRGVVQLRACLRFPPVGIVDIFRAPSKNEAIARLASATGWPAQQVTWLAGVTALNLADVDFQNEKKLLGMVTCFTLSAKAGATVEQLCRWANMTFSEADAMGAADEVKKALKAQHDDQTWGVVSKKINDSLRERRRGALVSYLLAHPERVSSGGTNPLAPTILTADDLYERLLIDVQMDACMLTSRIRQAISSVQLFVQRCLLGLEEEVPASSLSTKHWEWMKNYRVWEAGRRVFMYPENWIEPQLRDDKSAFFKEFETDLAKNELNKENVEEAFAAYLHKLEAIATPEIMGMYVDDDVDVRTGALRRRVHVIARTRTMPHTYYYRCQMDKARWTSWEKLTLDVEGDTVLPVVWERRLYLFWPLLTEKPQPDQPANIARPAKYWEIRFAYSEYRKGMWTPKLVLDKSVNLKGVEVPRNFSFKALTSSELILQVLVQTNYGWMSFNVQVAAEVRVSLCAGETSVAYKKQSHAQALPSDHEPNFDERVASAELESPAAVLWEELALMTTPMILRFNTWVVSVSNADVSLKEFSVKYGDYGADRMVSSTPRTTQVFGMLPSYFQLVVPHQFQQFAQQSPYFYQDTLGTYFVTPTRRNVRIPNHPRPDTGGMNLSGISLHFEKHSNEFVCRFLNTLHSAGIDGLLSQQTQTLSGVGMGGTRFAAHAPSNAVALPHPGDDVEFDVGSPNGIYHWELFFHAPLLIASKLSDDQRFAEAHRWFQYIFDPTGGAADLPAPKRYWNFLPLHLIDPTDPHNGTIQHLLSTLGDPSSSMAESARAQLREWIDDPFNPHLVARMRPVAYQSALLMRYIGNLVSWGDQLFRQDTLESINEATQLYVYAAKMLGGAPRAIPSAASTPPLTYATLGAIDEFANALEDGLPVGQGSSIGGGSVSGLTGGLGLDLLQYFCVPPNPRIMECWGTVADRLFKIRNCMNIEGVARQLPLYEPRIDPALLVRARAMGLDIAKVLSDVGAPAPHYRFTILLQKTLEFCASLKSLVGASLLSTMEKQDAEELSLMRSNQETELLNLMKEVKKAQFNEALRNREGLDKTWELTESRRQFYEMQINENGNGISAHEKEQQAQLDEAQTWQAAGQLVEAAASAACVYPDVTTGAGGGPGPVTTITFGASQVASGLRSAASVLNYVASVHTYWANEAGLLAGWERRSRDWALQLQSAKKELEQIEKQKLAADIRIDISGLEIGNQERQIEHAREVAAFYREKYTSKDLYDWMASRLSALHYQAYQMAFDLAKLTERAYRFELGLKDSNFVEFGYWDSGKKGLLAGEMLELALRRMERSYFDLNKRDYEITKHVSVQLFDPMALIALKQTGVCEVDLPESLFDADYPGHYMRRLKSVSLSLPCVVGPYTSVNATLTLLSNKTRIKPTSDDPYVEHADGDDERFAKNFGAIQSIATSHGQNDSGLFEVNFRDERFLPFEGAGAISRWRIELSRESNAFDPNSLTDVVLHLKYTARDGGKRLRDASFAVAQQARWGENDLLTRMFSLRHEFPEAWARFGNPTDPSSTLQQLEIPLSPERFPYQLRGRQLSVSRLGLFLIFRDPSSGIREYKRNEKLKFTVKPTEQSAWLSAKFECLNSVLDDTPHTLLDIAPALALPAKLVLQVAEGDVQLISAALRQQMPPTPDGRVRLRTDLIEDALLCLHYTTNEPVEVVPA